jgi:hypothetical protein
MTTPPPDFPDLSSEPKAVLISKLDYQCAPGCHTFACGLATKCGHWARGGGWCRECIDRELLRRGVDVVIGGSRYAYERVDGRIRRKLSGRA